MTLRFGHPALLYSPTADDRLWLSRAVEREGADSFQVAQTLVNLFCYLDHTSPEGWPTLTKLVRAYAQPVNPRWFPDGDLHLKWRGKQPNATDAHAIRRRDVYSKTTKFSRHVELAVARALEIGPVNIPANATDYAAARIDASKKYARLSEPRKGFNVLWSRDLSWGGYEVVP